MEKDPRQCKILRGAEQQINRQLSETVEELHRAEAIMGTQNAEIISLTRKRESLPKQQAVMLAASARSGAAGVVEVGLAIQIDAIDDEISSLQRALRISEQHVSKHRDIFTRWQNSLQENARRMKDLDCVI